MQRYGDTPILYGDYFKKMFDPFSCFWLRSGEWKHCLCSRRELTSPPQLRDITCSMPMYSMSGRPPDDLTFWNALPLGNTSWVQIQLLCPAILDFSALCVSYIHSIMNMLESKAAFSTLWVHGNTCWQPCHNYPMWNELSEGLTSNYSPWENLKTGP